VSIERIRDVLASTADPGEVVGELVALADDAGGPDNISVIVIDAGEVPTQPTTPVVLGAAAAEAPTG
jgi:protein phosphatase